MRPRAPRVMVLCRCGAYWMGDATIDNPVIDDHRSTHGAPISAAQYEALGFRIKWPIHWTANERNEARVRPKP